MDFHFNLEDKTMETTTMARVTPLEGLDVGNGADVRLNPNGEAMWLRLPHPVPCDGCTCDWCKRNPDRVPAWDTLAIPIHSEPNLRDYAYTIHAPGFWQPGRTGR